MTALFEKYGGFAKISRVVSAFYDKIPDSPILSPFFVGVDMRRLIEHQTKFIVQAMGGPVSYTDQELQRVHARLGVSEAAFNEMSALFRETLEDFGLEDEDIEFVCGQIAARKSYIVTKT